METHVSERAALVPQVLQRIREEIEALPPLPETVALVLKMTHDPDVSAAALTRVISRDQSLTANVLRLCNSAYYGLPRVISSINQAIMYLGFCAVRTLVLTSSMKTTLLRSLRAYGYENGGLWLHSVATAMAAETLCRRQRPDLSDVAYTVGLLHDVGKVVMSQYLNPHLAEVRMLVGEERVAFHEAERQVLGIDHAGLGADIAAHWNFPDELVESIRWHHAPQDIKRQAYLAHVACVADVAALRLGYGPSEEPVDVPAPAASLGVLGLDPSSLRQSCDEVEERVRKSPDFFA